MKKRIILLFVLALSVCTAHATRDTVMYGDSCYHFNPINISDCIARYQFGVLTAYTRHSMFLMGYEYNLPQDTKVYGVAMTAIRSEYDTDSAGYTVYLYTVGGEDKRLVCIDSVVSYSRATNYMYSAMHDGVQINSVAPCYEYFFPRPHVLSGPIYIGARWVPSYNYSDVYSPRCAAMDMSHSQMWIELDRDTIHYNSGMSAYWGGYFPIVQPERIGGEGAVAEVAERGDDYAALEWEMGGDSCQLSGAPYDVAADSGLVVDLTATSYTATGLDTGVYYAARLRTQCHHSCHIHADTVVWSGWGAPTLFYLGSEEPDTTGIGIRRVEAPIEFSVTPNPAHSNATVRCAAGLQTVELLGVKGDVLLRREAAGSEACVLDITGLAKGIYIVRITTPRGIAAQKLAVE